MKYLVLKIRSKKNNLTNSFILKVNAAVLECWGKK